MTNYYFRHRFTCGMKRKYPSHPAREVFEAAKSGDDVLLDKFLQQMNVSERTSALETKTSSNWGNEFEPQTKCTPLVVAAGNGNLDCVKILLTYKADIEGGGGDDNYHYYCKGYTPLFAAAANGHLDVLSCLVERGADVNALVDDCTPLMVASLNGHSNVVNFLVEHGAYMDLQDDDGNTALHCAIKGNSPEVAHILLTQGASRLYNNRRLTPLLLASDKCMNSVVEELIKRPDCTKEQRIDALEFLGARIAAPGLRKTGEALQYIKRGMEERFQDPLNPILKQPLEPAEAYHNRKESQTLEELARIEGDVDEIVMESLLIRERILGTYNIELLGLIRGVADRLQRPCYFNVRLGLHRHATKIATLYNKSITTDLSGLTLLFCHMIQNNLPPTQNTVLEALETTVLEYEKPRIKKMRRALKNESLGGKKCQELYRLFDSLFSFMLIFANADPCEEDREKNPTLLVLLRNVLRLNPRDDRGNTLLHLAITGGKEFLSRLFEFPCTKMVKFLVNAGINVNAINNEGDTPLHRAASQKPSDDKLHLLTGTLQILLDGSAHHDFINKDGKSAMEMAKTDEARRILSERKILELKCISARAVKRFGLPYLGVAPKILESFISMH